MEHSATASFSSPLYANAAVIVNDNEPASRDLDVAWPKRRSSDFKHKGRSKAPPISEPAAAPSGDRRLHRRPTRPRPSNCARTRRLRPKRILVKEWAIARPACTCVPGLTARHLPPPAAPDARIHAFMSADSLIHVHDLCKHFRTFRRREGVWGSIQNLFVREYRTVAAVDRVSFSIERGEMVGYIGPNGAGKSTTIKMLTGILVPTSGEIRINGFVPFRQRRQYVKTHRRGLRPAHAALVGHRRDRIVQAAAPDLRSSAARFRRAHGAFRRNPRTSATTCTRRCASFRSANACAAIWPPRCCTIRRCCFSTSRPSASTWSRRITSAHFLRAINREFRTTVLLTTHDLDDIEELCRRIMIIDHGRVLFDGQLCDLKQKLLRTKQIKFALKDREQVGVPRSFLARRLRSGASGRADLSHPLRPRENRPPPI